MCQRVCVVAMRHLPVRVANCLQRGLSSGDQHKVHLDRRYHISLTTTTVSSLHNQIVSVSRSVLFCSAAHYPIMGELFSPLKPKEYMSMTTNTNKPAGTYASVNGIQLYYEIHGTGKPLIMLHGGFGTFDMFAALSPAL